MPKNHKADVTIIGAGLTGITMACSLAENGISVTVIEAGNLKNILAKKSDGRTCAISYGSAQIFKQMDVWPDMEKHAGPILDIRATDSNSPLFLHYDHKLVGNNPMGYIIENFYIRKALFKKAKSLKKLKIIDSTEYISIDRNKYNAIVKLKDTDITSSLVIAADGRNSKVRDDAGIKTNSWPYKQSGIVCTVKHEKKHDCVAIEKFLPAGPFAILPMKEQNLSSIVWTESSDVAPLFMKMSDEEFLEQLDFRFNGYLGKLEVIGKRFIYPMSLVLARKYTDTRLALIGDAAHGMHPIAGQGFNLGIRDVPALTKLILNFKNLGLDIGNQQLLLEYEKLRKFDSTSLVTITDILNRLFSNDIPPLKYMRRAGMAAINKMPPLRKAFIKHAMGLSEFV